MPEPTATPAMPNRWRNPVFLGIFVPGAVVWLAVVAWATWRYFNPVGDWLGRQHPAVQEVLGTIFFLGWAVVLVWGLVAVSTAAERAAGLPPSGTTCHTEARHTGWKPPKRT